jgi:tetratricopeptide (TPR) repeat protein
MTSGGPTKSSSSAERAERRVRPVFVLAFVAGVLVLATVGPHLYRRYRNATDEARHLRTTALVEVAPAPLPTGLPIVGDATPGPDGYAAAHVDKAALRSLFWHRKFDDLTHDFEALEDAFESDPRKEYWPIDAGDAFDTAEPALLTKLDAWAAAHPDSFAPYLARGAYELAVGEARRGHHWTKDTPGADLEAMMEPLRRSKADLRKALELRPKLVAAMRLLIDVDGWLGDDAGKRDAIDQATTACGACFQVRATYLLMTSPRWGGTYAAMDAFASAAPVGLNPRLALLAGYADLDRATLATNRDDYGEATKYIERAMKRGEHWAFAFERGRIRGYQKNWTDALADFDRANTLRADVTTVVFWRARALNNIERYEEAAHALLEGLRVSTTDEDARELFPYVVGNLDWCGWDAFKKGKRADALRMYDLAAELAPTERELLQRRAHIIVGSDHPDIPALQKAVRENPDDLRLHQQLDYSLASEGRFREVVAMWTDYIARHPDEATAYRERGGAYFQLRDVPAARADAAKACELGDNEGCAHAH